MDDRDYEAMNKHNYGNDFIADVRQRFIMTKKQILKLRPEFKLGMGMTMIDWFEITEGAGFFCIRSGLRHADGETKSPYHYEDCVGGKNAEKIAMDKFNKWWDSLNVA